MLKGARASGLRRGGEAGSLRDDGKEIEAFIRFLAVERGLIRKLSALDSAFVRRICCLVRAAETDLAAREVGLPLISEYLAERKRGGLSASSIKLIVVALKIFFRFATAQGFVSARSDGIVVAPADRALSAGDAE